MKSTDTFKQIIPGIQAKDLQSCPDYRKDSTSKPPPPPKEKVTELKLF